MKEDIKILETFKKRVEYVRILCFGLSDEEVEEIGKEGYLQKVKQAIENLIARNKKLEKENKTLKGFTSSVFNDSIEKEYIPKSKVKEKIEELNDVNSKFSQRVIKSKEFYLTELVQNILQELLEE